MRVQGSSGSRALFPTFCIFHSSFFLLARTSAKARWRLQKLLWSQVLKLDRSTAAHRAAAASTSAATRRIVRVVVVVLSRCSAETKKKKERRKGSKRV